MSARRAYAHANLTIMESSVTLIADPCALDQPVEGAVTLTTPLPTTRR